MTLGEGRSTLFKPRLRKCLNLKWKGRVAFQVERRNLSRLRANQSACRCSCGPSPGRTATKKIPPLLRLLVRSAWSRGGEGKGEEAVTPTNSSRSEEHTSELQSHSFISYAVFCLK